MKKCNLFILVLILFTSNSYSQADSNFYNFGWAKMADEGYDYSTIKATAENYYDSAKMADKQYKFKHYLRWNH